jgi:heat shock protein HslJ
MIAVAAVAVVALAACGSDNSATSAAPTTAPSVGTAAKVEQTTWELNLDSLNVPDLAHARPTMRLVGGTASGSTGCNLYTGPYTIGPDRLTFGVLAQTNVACGPEETAIESAFVPRLGMTAKYTLNGNQLQLQDVGGAVLLTFDPANTSLQGSWTVLGYLRSDASAFTSVAVGSTLTANFGADGMFSGNTGCNNVTGAWKQGPGDAVTIGPLATTLAACTSADLSAQEHSYLAALQASVRAEVTSSSAALFNAAGMRTLELTR